MFIARFTLGTNERFEQLDENGNPTGVYNFIGEVLAGSYKSSIINHDIFVDGGHAVGVNYLCDTKEVVGKDGVTYNNVVIIMPIENFKDMLEARALCGDIRNLIPQREAKAKPVDEFATAPTTDEDNPFLTEEVAPVPTGTVDESVTNKAGKAPKENA